MSYKETEVEAKLCWHWPCLAWSPVEGLLFHGDFISFARL